MSDFSFFVDTSREIPLDTNSGMFSVMEWVTVVGAVVNLFGLFVIVFHTPSSMKTYGRALSAYQVISLLADGLVGSGLAPYLIFPVPGGLPVGWMWQFGLTTQLQIFLGFVFIGHMVTLIVTMFVVRHQTIMPGDNILKMRPSIRLGFYSFMQVWPYLHFGIMFFFVFSNDDQPKKYPIFRQFILVPRFYAFSDEAGILILINVSVWVVIVVVIVGGAILTSFYILESRRDQISVRTFKLQRKWIHKCILQVSIPMITILTPILGGVYIFVTKTVAMFGLIPTAELILSLHGSLSTTVTLMLYRPYYAYVEQIELAEFPKLNSCYYKVLAEPPPTNTCFHAEVAPVKIPAEYPFAPPVVTITKYIHHPAVALTGEVNLPCLDPKNWKPTITLKEVLGEVALRIAEPNQQDAVRPELANALAKDRKDFFRMAPYQVANPGFQLLGRHTCSHF
ncbi:unnamed protein product, partial [Mesorhabditis spiculigera]